MLLLVVLPGIYLISPEFYLRHVLEAGRREFQAVETLTALCAMAGGLVLAGAAHRMWAWTRQEQVEVASGSWARRAIRRHSGVAVLAVVALACIFFAGEEISWGQHYIGWSTPDSLAAYSVETNLHNVKSWWMPSIQGLGSLFLIGVAFVLPLAWRFRDALGLPASLGVAIARWPVMIGIGAGFALEWAKTAYRRLLGESAAFYAEYMEQINEQKEMAFSMSLLVYGVQCARNVSCTRRGGSGGAGVE